MQFLRSPLALLVLALVTAGCHAQTSRPGASSAQAKTSTTSTTSKAAATAQGRPVSAAVQHRIDVLLRQKANLPPGSNVLIGPRLPSDVPGYDKVAVSFGVEGKVSHPVNFLLSTDGKTLAQFSKFDISADPRDMVSAAGRPSRGGPANAPVVIVGFDDLECPFCARLHESIFPALIQRYGNKVHFVYKDYPLDQHPWAMHAAVDVNCMAAQSDKGYWNLVDYIHGHVSDIGADPKDPKADKTLPRAEAQLDQLTREQGQYQKANMPELEACLKKQDTSGIEASKKVGDGLGIDSTPTLFINGEKIEGAVPLDFLFGQIDESLRAEGVTPPPPYVAPAPPIADPAHAAAAATKPAQKK